MACWRQSRQSPDRDSVSDQIGVLSLTFKDVGLETGFLLQQSPKLLLNVRMFSLVVGVVALLGIVSDHLNDPGISSITDGWLQRHLFQLLIVLLCTLALCVSHPSLACKAGPRAVEAVVICVAVGILWCAVLGVPWYHARLRGRDPDEVIIEESHSDTMPLLVLDAMTTSVHMVLPLRSGSLLPFQICSVLAYAVPAFVLGGPEQKTAPFNLVLLSGLTCLAVYGKRDMERHERASFLSFLREKQLRFQSERQLSAHLERRPGNPSAGSMSTEASVPDTTGTGIPFDLSRGADHDGEVLKQLIEAGEKEQWLVRRQEVCLVPGAFLGKGGFGVVQRGLYHGAEVAVKAPKVTDEEGTVRRDTLVEMCNELRVLRRLRHPHICFLYGAVLNSSDAGIKICLILELIEGVPLARFVRQSAGEDAKKMWLLVDLASALSYLHERRPAVVHGDLKDSNVFALKSGDGTWGAKLLDFGLARLVTKSARPLGGTLRWMAPELMRGDVGPTGAVDVFSLGRVLYFVAAGRRPFEGQGGERLPRLVKRCPTLPWPPGLSERLVQGVRPLSERCTDKKRARRPGMKEVLEKVQDVCVLLGPRREGSNVSSSSNDRPPISCATTTAGGAPSVEEAPKAEPRADAFAGLGLSAHEAKDVAALASPTPDCLQAPSGDRALPAVEETGEGGEDGPERAALGPKPHDSSRDGLPCDRSENSVSSAHARKSTISL